MSKYLAFLCVVIFLSSSFTKTQYIVSDCEPYNGTTGNLREIVIGRCYDFLNTMHKDIKCQEITNKYDCIDIWNKFNIATIGKDPCDIKMEDYNDFFRATDHLIKANSSLFWSGTNILAHESKSISYNYSSSDGSVKFHFNSFRFVSIRFKNCVL